MLGTCVLVGRVVDTPVITKTAKGNSVSHMLLDVDRPFKNDDGNVDTDRFKVTLWRGIAEECMDHCHEGSIVAVRGRLQSSIYEKDDKEFYNYEIVAEKVSYLDE